MRKVNYFIKMKRNNIPTGKKWVLTTRNGLFWIHVYSLTNKPLSRLSEDPFSSAKWASSTKRREAATNIR